MRAVALSTRLNRFAADVRSRTEANGLSTTFVVRRCFQWASGVERDHAVPVILEHRHSFRVPRITFAERLTSFERLGPCRGVGTQQFLGLRLLALRQPIQDVPHLVSAFARWRRIYASVSAPACLSPGFSPDFPYGPDRFAHSIGVRGGDLLAI